MEVSINGGITDIRNRVIYLDGKRVDMCSKIKFEMDGNSIPVASIELLEQQVKIQEDDAKIILVVGDRKFRVVEEL